MKIITKKDDKISTLFKSMDRVLNKLEKLREQYKPSLNGEKYLTDRELSLKLNISRRTLQDYRTQGLISYIQFGGKVLYRESDIETLLEKCYFKAWKL